MAGLNVVGSAHLLAAAKGARWAGAGQQAGAAGGPHPCCSPGATPAAQIAGAAHLAASAAAAAAEVEAAAAAVAAS